MKIKSYRLIMRKQM